MPSTSVRDLGIYIDSDASMRTHVSKTVSTCFAVLRQIRSIRRSVSQQVLRSLVTSLVLTRLEYGNATLAGLQSSQLNRLQSVMKPHGLYSLHGSPSTSHRYFMTFTGCGCLSGLSLNSLCLSTVACTVWLRHTLHASCAVWQTSTHDDDCAPHRHLRSKCHRRVMLPSATVPLVSPLRVYGILCRPTSCHRHQCLSSSDISKHSYTQILKRDIAINYLTSVKCSRSFFLSAPHLKILMIE